MVTIIAAVAENRVICLENRVPWRLSSDFQMFKRTTMGHPLIMGRKTFESLPGILPGRPHVVITHQLGYQQEHPDIAVAHSLKEAIKIARMLSGGDEVFISGGSEIYKEGFAYANRLMITRVYASPGGDIFFPDFDKSQWILEKSEMQVRGEKDQHNFSFEIYRKKE